MPQFRAISGDLIQLDPFPKKDERRYASRVIGLLGNQSLLINVPVVEGSYIIVRPDQMFTARMMHSNQVIGFQTQVLKVLSSPAPYLHLRIPLEFEARQIRQSRRCQIKHKIQVRAGKQDKQDAILEDISIDGARMISRVPLGEVSDSIKLYLSIDLFERHFELNVNSTIRRINHNRDSVYEYGTSFHDLADQPLLMLGGWINEMLLQQVYD